MRSRFFARVVLAGPGAPVRGIAKRHHRAKSGRRNLFGVSTALDVGKFKVLIEQLRQHACEEKSQVLELRVAIEEIARSR